MPIVHVRALAPKDPAKVSTVMKNLGSAVATACKCPPAAIWSTFTALEVFAVGEELKAGEGQMAFVDVVMMPGDAVASALEAACKAVAEGLDLPLTAVFGRFQEVRSREAFKEKLFVKG